MRPTSALDNITEARLKDVLRDEKITVIAIAHRIDSIANCNNIIVLDKGRIVQQGAHEQLAEVDGIYKNLCKGNNITRIIRKLIST